MTSSHQMPIVWAIGGVDSLNLAGLGADIRSASFGNNGVHCATIVTCVTGQNSKAFRAAQTMSSAMLDAQWHALSEQTTANVIKVGMLADIAQVQWLAGKLSSLRANAPALRVIYDPVLRATASNQPVDSQLLQAIKDYLLPHVDLLTPNTIEASMLCGREIHNAHDILGAAQQLSAQHQLNVLIKGGHAIANNSSRDCYIGLSAQDFPRFASEPSQGFALASDFIVTEHSRGSGCTLASLIAGLVAQQYTFCDAIVVAKSILTRALTKATACGNDKGGLLDLAMPNRFEQLPSVLSLAQFVNQKVPCQQTPFLPCPSNLGLYPVVDNCLWLERLLKLGVKTIQLRAKDLSDELAEPQVIEAIALGEKYQARVFINDYWRLAIKHQAYGVHLGQEDLTQANLEQIKDAGLRLGLSTHGIFEALEVNALGPSYLALGHIYATQTKDMPSNPQGIDKLSLQVGLFREQRSLVAIGGISTDRVAPVLGSGIASVALVTAITKADDADAVTKALLKQVGSGCAHRVNSHGAQFEVIHG